MNKRRSWILASAIKSEVLWNFGVYEMCFYAVRGMGNATCGPNDTQRATVITANALRLINLPNDYEDAILELLMPLLQ